MVDHWEQKELQKHVVSVVREYLFRGGVVNVDEYNYFMEEGSFNVMKSSIPKKTHVGTISIDEFTKIADQVSLKDYVYMLSSLRRANEHS